MKRLFLTITIGLCGLLAAQTLGAQESLRERMARRQNQQNSAGQSSLTVRARIMNESQTQEIENAPWVREIYRFIDLEKEKNATLYFPVTPIGERTNLFTLIFRHLQNGDITAYKFKLDGSDDLTENNIEPFKDILENLDIMYQLENDKYIIEDIDIPGNEVLGYYIKEAWYFDKNNSVVDIKTLAICPILLREDEFSAGRTRYPLFWVSYESIRPYTSRMPIMVSSLNNATTLTINDFFIKHLYEGSIEKATNVRNLTMAQQYPDEAKRKIAQQRVENELKEFEANLWVYNDSIAANMGKAKIDKSKGPNIKNAPLKNGDSNTNRATIQKEAKTQSAPARSMRNRNRN